MLEAVAAEGIGPRFAAHVAALRAWLVERYGLPAAAASRSSCAREAWDATWWNVVVDPDDGRWQVVDEEWSFDFPLPADYVVWRCLHHFALRHALHLPLPERGEDAHGLADRWLEAAVGPLPPGVLRGFADLDRFLGVCAAPLPLPAEAPELHATLAALGAPARIVLADAEELAADGALLLAFLDRFGAAEPVRLVLVAPGGREEELAAALGARTGRGRARGRRRARRGAHARAGGRRGLGGTGGRRVRAAVGAAGAPGAGRAAALRGRRGRRAGGERRRAVGGLDQRGAPLLGGDLDAARGVHDVARGGADALAQLAVVDQREQPRASRPAWRRGSP